ncbi:MAG: SPOR domain-containing protein [bacterium]
MHKKTFILGTSILLILCALFIDLYAQVKVRGYYRKDGTYVRPHTRSSPDGNPYNNYSFPGNYNPNTGKISTGNPETYLKNYYNRNNSSYPSYSTGSTTSYYSTPNTSSYSTDTPASVNSLLVDLRNRINENVGYDIDIKLLDDLIISLQKLKTKISSTNSSYSSANKTVFSDISNQPSSFQYQSHMQTYHIIVYSETTRERADSRVREIQSHYILSNYEIQVLPAVVNGRQWYRVALGDFGTYPEVKEKLSLLSASIPGDSWILKN